MQNILKNRTYEAFNQQILTHWQDSIEIIRVLEGKLHCLINGNEHIVEKDNICIINSQQLHRIYTKDKSCKAQQILIDFNIIPTNHIIHQKYIKPLLEDKEFSHIIASSNHQYIRDILNIFDEISKLEQNKPETYEISLLAANLNIIQKLYIIYQETKDGKNNYEYTDMVIYRNMVNYIYQNYDQKISLEDIANSGNISKSKCCNIFKKYAQYSPINFLNSYRLKKSTDLLKTSDDSLSNISFNCGFLQQSYFNRLFIKEYKMTPKQYQNLYRTNKEQFLSDH